MQVVQATCNHRRCRRRKAMAPSHDTPIKRFHGICATRKMLIAPILTRPRTDFTRRLRGNGCSSCLLRQAFLFLSRALIIPAAKIESEELRRGRIREI